MRLKAGKCPSEALSLTNRVVLHPRDRDMLNNSEHIIVATGPGGDQRKIFSVITNDQMLAGYVGFSLPQRKWTSVDVNQDLEISIFEPHPAKSFISSMVVDIDFFNKKKVTQDNYDTDMMAKEFLNQFPNQVFTLGQPVVFQFKNMPLTQLIIKDIECTDLHALQSGRDVKPQKVNHGISLPNTAIVFEKAEGSPIHLIGKSKGKVVRQSIINPDWDFSKMGIGGLDTEFNAIFRRAFASRVFPPEIMEQLGCKHVKGS